MQFPLKASSGKRVPFRGDILGCSFRNDLPRESVSHSEALNWDAVSAWHPKGKRIPFRAQHRDAVSVHNLPHRHFPR